MVGDSGRTSITVTVTVSSPPRCLHSTLFTDLVDNIINICERHINRTPFQIARAQDVLHPFLSLSLQGLHRLTHLTLALLRFNDQPVPGL